MDAEQLTFPDDSFDVVVAQYVVTTVPNPEATLDEFARVLKPGGEIILVSRVGAEAGLRRVIEHWLRAGGAQARLAHRVFVRALRCAGPPAPTACVLIERRAMPPLGHFSLIRFAQDHRCGRRRQERPAMQPTAERHR